MVRGRALLGAVLLALSAAAAGAGAERDPHEASGGFTRTSGPYRVPGGPPRLADEHPWWAVWGERFEYQPDPEVLTWDLEASWGGTWRRLVARAEGHRVDGTAEESAGELLWARALDPYFDLRAGVRREWLAEGPERTWFALGVAGLAPDWFHLDATAYLGDGGRSALNLHATYDLLFSQRLVLEPRAELWIYGEGDPANGRGSGPSDLQLGLRLRCEVSRQFAPYLGVEWRRRLGDGADFARAAGEEVSRVEWLAGVRFWF